MIKRPIAEVLDGFVSNGIYLSEIIGRRRELDSASAVKVFLACGTKANKKAFWPVVLEMCQNKKVNDADLDRLIEADIAGNSTGHYGRQAQRIRKERIEAADAERKRARGHKGLRRATAAA